MELDLRDPNESQDEANDEVLADVIPSSNGENNEVEETNEEEAEAMQALQESCLVGLRARVTSDRP